MRFFIVLTLIAILCGFTFKANSADISTGASTGAPTCTGKLVNPITDICWSCIFPLTIGAVPVTGAGEDTDNPANPICVCPRPGVPVPVPGVSLGLWEPVYLVDVTRTPYCMVNLGGVSLASNFSKQGGASTYVGNNSNSFYHVHVYTYPLLYWMEILTDAACLEKGTIDLAYMSEFDPTWDDDEVSFLMHPEVALFSSLPAQVACGVDCAAVSFDLAIDKLFWCAGCLGSIYPFSGFISGHIGGVQSAKLIATRAIAKLHRAFMMWETSGAAAQCQKLPAPIIKKSQYKLQMTYPVAETGGIAGSCKPLGRNNLTDSAGKEFPYKGEDWGFAIWRKRNCCAL